MNIIKSLFRCSVLWCLLLMVATACIEPIDFNGLNTTPTGKIVVEGLITNEKKAHWVRISRTGAPIPQPTPTGVSQAIVSISEGIHRYQLHELDTLPGTYATADTVQGEAGKTYTLYVQVNGEEYTASATMAPVSPFMPIQEIFRAPNRIENPLPNTVDIYQIEFPKVRYGVATPSQLVYHAQDPISKEHLRAFHYEFPGIDPQGFLLNFQGSNAHLILEEGIRIDQYKYSMTQENYEFVQAVYAQTAFKGGLLDRISGNVPTNLSNGALGFFAASEVISRSFVFRKDLLR